MEPSPIATLQDGNSNCVEITVADTRLVADPSGALWWPEERTLLVADLHLEKGSSYARRGTFLPPYDSRATLKRLGEVLSRFAADRVILLGDSFHDRDATGRLGEQERELLWSMQNQLDWIWITGNHDPAISSDMRGQVVDVLKCGALILRHEPGPVGSIGEIAGHLHPAARIVRYGRSIRRRCFVANDDRLIMPAFGAYTGGLNVCDPVFDDLLNTPTGVSGARIWMLGEHGVYAVSTRELRGD